MEASKDFGGLTNEELLTEYQKTGELSMKQELVMRYVYIVRSIAIQMRDVYVSFAQIEDIVNEGVLVIMSALDKFDPEKNVKFETYISKRIKGITRPISWAYCRRKITIRLIILPPLDSSTRGIRL